MQIMLSPDVPEFIPRGCQTPDSTNTGNTEPKESTSRPQLTKSSPGTHRPSNTGHNPSVLKSSAFRGTAFGSRAPNDSWRQPKEVYDQRDIQTQDISRHESTGINQGEKHTQRGRGKPRPVAENLELHIRNKFTMPKPSYSYTKILKSKQPVNNASVAETKSIKQDFSFSNDSHWPTLGESLPLYKTQEKNSKASETEKRDSNPWVKKSNEKDELGDSAQFPKLVRGDGNKHRVLPDKPAQDDKIRENQENINKKKYVDVPKGLLPINASDDDDDDDGGLEQAAVTYRKALLSAKAIKVAKQDTMHSEPPAKTLMDVSPPKKQIRTKDPLTLNLQALAAKCRKNKKREAAYLEEVAGVVAKRGKINTKKPKKRKISRVMKCKIEKRQKEAVAMQLLLAREKRYVCGLKETTKLMGKMSCVIMAPNIQQCEGPGSLDDTVEKLLNQAEKLKVPVVFALSTKEMKYLCRKSSRKVSCFGIINYQGAQDIFQRLMQLMPEAQKQYQELVASGQCSLPKDGEDEEEEEEEGEPLKKDLTSEIVNRTKSLLMAP
ncbi:Selenocysteine insertion sequence-binding protein 2-like [Portunus trituberculatus]|uniref:Selenocysteine insertion sequence-binding protein 2-like n=1 Tax=Portunus trituberculatus TaxID=210409 RepID=A0A5B7FCE8_PORTR|nr:Selenocysteine insertion sequence-binding protein 2-like [Portunus trituberculatus]